MNGATTIDGRDRPLRVLHFVSGGFSGATQVAIDLCGHDPDTRSLLVLRRKRQTSPHRIDELRRCGVEVETVPAWPHGLTVLQLARLCRAWRPDVLVAHGFSEHLWGRWAGLLAGVPHLVQVEHNVRERYGRWRLWQSRWLARRTDAIVAVSDSVRRSLIERGHPAAQCVVIPNGIDLERWPSGPSWEAREPSIIMAARFARQKDPLTLIRAADRLRQRGMPMHVYLAGGGSAKWRARAEREIDALDLRAWVHVLGPVGDLPQRCRRVRYCVLSTHHEGLPLALVEGMASGCCPLGSDVEGVRDVIAHGRNGLLFPAGDADALADALQALEREPARAARLAEAAAADARARFDRTQMRRRYAALLHRIARHGAVDADVSLEDVASASSPQPPL